MLFEPADLAFEELNAIVGREVKLISPLKNDFQFNSINYLTNNGFVNNFKLYFKNLNSLGKNDTIYKSRPSVDAMGIAEINASLPIACVLDLDRFVIQFNCT